MISTVIGLIIGCGTAAAFIVIAATWMMKAKCSVTEAKPSADEFGLPDLRIPDGSGQHRWLRW